MPQLPEDDLDLPRLVDEITRAGYWVEDPPSARERLFHAVLAHSRRLDETQGASSPVRLEPGLPESEAGTHEAAWNALRSRLDEHPGLTGRLAGAIAYPLPHAPGRSYAVDLLLPDDSSAEQLSEFLREYRVSLRRRLFRLGKFRFTSTAMLHALAESPRVQHATPFPFFREHLQRYGLFLAGARREMLSGKTDRRDLVAWCRHFLPYYMSTLGRRIEHSSAAINFTQLASVRLFLETGAVETDAAVVRRRHRELAGKHGPDDRTWDYLQRDRPGREDREGYRRALAAFAYELERVRDLPGMTAAQPPSPSRPGSTPPIVAS